MTTIPLKLKRLAEDYGAKIHRDTVNCQPNQAGSAGRDIFLGKFDDPDIEVLAFFHELGHTVCNEVVCKRGFTMTKISSEGLAWELGLGMAFDNGYVFDRDSKAMRWARAQLETYRKDDNNWK